MSIWSLTYQQSVFKRYHSDKQFSGVFTYTQGDGDAISMPAGFRRHLVGKTPINVFHCDVAEMRFIGKIVITLTFS